MSDYFKSVMAMLAESYRANEITKEQLGAMADIEEEDNL